MIDISVLYCAGETASQPHRYGRKIRGSLPEGETAYGTAQRAAARRPIVVWNCTRSCNLRCLHCYSDSEPRIYPGELTTEEAKNLIEDLAGFKVPALLFSGGEPLMRGDLFTLVEFARNLGLRTVLSTNGTLITPPKARRIKEASFSYVGVSLDGMGETNDVFRGVEGAYDRAVSAFRNLIAVGQKTGLRMTLTKQNAQDLPRIFDFIEKERIQRACFYHLVPSGRGGDVADLKTEDSRKAMDIILERAMEFHKRNLPVEILTVDNHCDGPYLFLRMTKEKNPRASQVYDLLRWNGGGLHSSGVGIACVDWNGNVHPDQFWMRLTLGNIRERKFSEIWQDSSHPILAGLRNRLPLLKGRCGLCRFKELCGGAMRARAEAFTGDFWAEDPACYLTDEEIGLRGG